MRIINDDLMVCTDCAMLLANGQLPEEEPYTSEYRKRLDAAIEREGTLANWVLTYDEDSEEEFSWSSCDLCESHLGGSRFPAAILGEPLPAMTEIRARWDSGDKYGSAMSEFFGIATALHLRDEEVPEDWQYRHGALTEEDVLEDELWPDTYWLQSLDDGTHTADDLRHAGNVLARYADNLRRLGLDY